MQLTIGTVLDSWERSGRSKDRELRRAFGEAVVKRYYRRGVLNVSMVDGTVLVIERDDNGEPYFEQYFLLDRAAPVGPEAEEQFGPLVAQVDHEEGRHADHWEEGCPCCVEEWKMFERLSARRGKLA